jgi:quercetin dioxygenase-like cupin family protein
MRHRLLPTPLLALIAVFALTGLFASGLAAQEATPGPIAAIELAPGFTVEVFAGAPSDRAPGQTVYLARFVFQPGAEIFPHSHPGTTVLGVQSGSLGWTLLEGTAHVVRGAAAGATGPTEDLTEPGSEVVLEPGDAIFYEDDVVHTARGAGDEETVVLGTLLLTSGEPLLMPAEEMAEMDMEATPAA